MEYLTTENISILLIVIGILTFLVNVCTQIFKQFTTNNKFVQPFVIIVSIILTVVLFFAFCSIKSISVVWYMVVAAVIVGILVAYAAMFGYDTLKEMILKFKNGGK